MLVFFRVHLPNQFVSMTIFHFLKLQIQIVMHARLLNSECLVRNCTERAFSTTDLLDLVTVVSSEKNLDYLATQTLNCSPKIK